MTESDCLSNLQKFVFRATALVVMTACAAAAESNKSSEYLVRALAADQRCTVLSVAERKELSEFVAAAQQSADKAAIKRATAIGTSVRCDTITARGIRGVLKSARVQGLPKLTPTNVAAAELPVAASDNEILPAQQEPEKVAVVKPVEEVPQNTVNTPEKVEPAAKINKPKPKPSPKKKGAVRRKRIDNQVPNTLRRYENMATAYFKELRCPTMSRGEVFAFYENVRRMHRKSVAIFGTGEVANIVRRAASRAKAGNC